MPAKAIHDQICHFIMPNTAKTPQVSEKTVCLTFSGEAKPLNWMLHLIILKSQAISPELYFNLKQNSLFGVVSLLQAWLRYLWITFTVCLLTTSEIVMPVGDFHKAGSGERGRLEKDLTQQNTAPSYLKPKQVFWGWSKLLDLRNTFDVRIQQMSEKQAVSNIPAAF